MAQYGYSKTVALPFGEAVEKVKSAFQQAGFGVLCDIDVQEKFKKKLGIDYPSYRILGLCDPAKAQQALEADLNIGLLLPCNVVVYVKNGDVVVSAILPTQLFTLIDNPAVATLAKEVEAVFRQTIDSL